MKRVLLFLIFQLTISASSIFPIEQNIYLFDEVLSNPFEYFSDEQIVYINSFFELNFYDNDCVISFLDLGTIKNDGEYYIFIGDNYRLFLPKLFFEFKDNSIFCEKEIIRDKKLIVIRDILKRSNEYKQFDKNGWVSFYKDNWLELRAVISGKLTIFEVEPFAGLKYEFIIRKNQNEIELVGLPNIKVASEGFIEQQDVIGVFEGERRKYGGKTIQLAIHTGIDFDVMSPIVIYFVK